MILWINCYVLLDNLFVKVKLSDLLPLRVDLFVLTLFRRRRIFLNVLQKDHEIYDAEFGFKVTVTWHF